MRNTIIALMLVLAFAAPAHAQVQPIEDRDAILRSIISELIKQVAYLQQLLAERIAEKDLQIGDLNAQAQEEREERERKEKQNKRDKERAERDNAKLTREYKHLRSERNKLAHELDELNCNVLKGLEDCLRTSAELQEQITDKEQAMERIQDKI